MMASSTAPQQSPSVPKLKSGPTGTPDLKRYPAAIMATCVVPWTPDYHFDERLFRAQVRDQARTLTKHLYIFGTAGEGYAVTESQFSRIARVFFEEAREERVEATLGIIHLSLPTIIERIEKAREWGYRRFQLSLPAWGALKDAELAFFFRETCGRFRDCTFMHYNLVRTKRVLNGTEYGRLADEHPNFVATKNGKDDETFLVELFEKAPQLQHFLGEYGYCRMRDRYECGLLISIASTNPKRAHAFVAARGAELPEIVKELRAAQAALHKAVGPEPHIDGAFDKLLFKLRSPSFPLRLLPPYIAGDEETLSRYQAAMAETAPMWLPSAGAVSQPAAAN